jgi:hypothetical protein
MPEIRKPPVPAAAAVLRRAPPAPAAVKIVQGKLAPLPPCGCGGKLPPIQMSKQHKKQAALYDQAGRNWDNYACYESSFAKDIERYFAEKANGYAKARQAIINFMIARDMGGDNYFPGHCSATSASKQNAGTKSVIDAIHKVFENYMNKNQLF